MSPSYAHRQIAWYLLVIMVILGGYMLTVTIIAGRWIVGVPVTILVILVYAMLAVLRTEVDRKAVTIGFTFGWPKREIPLASITSVEQLRNKWWHGWGIRLIPGGMLYSVSGLDAVEIRYHDKRKGKDRMFRAGTDDAAGLVAAIEAARSTRR